MKLTKAVISFFEQEQKEFGTEIALSNLLWQDAAQSFKDLGVVRIKTVYKSKKKGQNK